MGSARVSHRLLPVPDVDLGRAAAYGLSEHEARMAAAAASGRTDEQCRVLLGVPLGTAKGMMRRVLRKLKCNDRVSAVYFCGAVGIFERYTTVTLPAQLQPSVELVLDASPSPRPVAATFATALALEITEIRLMRNLTQAELAEKVGVATGSMRAFESGGRSIPADRLFDICSALGVRTDAVIQLAEARLLVRAMRRNASRGRGALTKVNLDTDEIEDGEDGENAEEYG